MSSLDDSVQVAMSPCAARNLGHCHARTMEVCHLHGLCHMQYSQCDTAFAALAGSIDIAYTAVTYNAQSHQIFASLASFITSLVNISPSFFSSLIRPILINRSIISSSPKWLLCSNCGSSP